MRERRLAGGAVVALERNSFYAVAFEYDRQTGNSMGLCCLSR